jgi:hypothetical protein
VTYLDYIIFLEKCDQVEALSGNAYKLYLKLLAIANVIGWPKEFAKSDPYMAGVCDIASNTMTRCRAELEKRGLIKVTTGGIGRKAAATYELLKPAKIEVFTDEKASKIEVIEPVNTSKIEAFTPENGLNTSGNTSKIEGLILDKEKEVVVSAASAAAPASISEPAKKSAAKTAKGATHAEVAALPLPFEGAEFAETWRSFYTTNPKQAGKNISAFVLMLKKLGNYPEGFAVLMLERAIMGNWQGIENAGTARDFADWQQQQASQPKPAAPLSAEPEAPQMNQEFLAQQAAAAEARRAARLAELAAA